MLSWIKAPARFPGDRRSRIELLAVLAVALAGVCAHFYGLSALPRGFYVDESSIAYNAWRIAQSGADEHGERWPLFFRAFGEYKNPVYIYLLSALYRLLGYGEWLTRAASAVCWLLGSLALARLGWKLFSAPAARIYLVVCLCFTPWLFSLSRVSFELIALYPLLALHLLAVYMAYEEGAPLRAAWAGVLIGLTVYAYSTFRLLAPLFALAVVAAYPSRVHWRRNLALLAAAAVTAAPFGVYLLRHGENLLHRFDGLTFLRDPDLGPLAKAQILLDHYAGYFGIRFLAATGDPNLRHHTGYCGELLPCSFLLLVVGLAWLAGDGRLWRSGYVRLLVMGGLLSPLAASLTSDHGHSLRAFTLSIFAILLSTWGLEAIARSGQARIAAAAVLLAACNAAQYTADYFTRYAEASADAFEGYGFKEALDAAVRRGGGRVVVSPNGNQPYIQLLFYSSLVQPRPAREVTMADGTPLGPDDLVITFDRGDPEGKARWQLPPRSQFTIVRGDAAPR